MSARWPPTNERTRTHAHTLIDAWARFMAEKDVPSSPNHATSAGAAICRNTNTCPGGQRRRAVGVWGGGGGGWLTAPHAAVTPNMACSPLALGAMAVPQRRSEGLPPALPQQGGPKLLSRALWEGQES